MISIIKEAEGELESEYQSHCTELWLTMIHIFRPFIPQMWEKLNGLSFHLSLVTWVLSPILQFNSRASKMWLWYNWTRLNPLYYKLQKDWKRTVAIKSWTHNYIATELHLSFLSEITGIFMYEMNQCNSFCSKVENMFMKFFIM